MLTLRQQFSDDEGEVDEPLVPLPDEPEVVDGDEDEQDEARNDAAEVPQVKDLPDMETQDDPPSKVPSPKPQLMMLETLNDDDNQATTEVLDASLKPLEGGLDGVDDNGKEGSQKGSNWTYRHWARMASSLKARTISPSWMAQTDSLEER